MTEDNQGIPEFFSGSNIFLTGVTGFIGKLLVEKLLRSCSGLRKVYVLIRVKKGKHVLDRFEDLFSVEIFDRLKLEQPDFLNKIVLIPGDLALPNLGLSDSDKELLIKEVDIVLHCAATVRFDQSLKQAAYINVRSVLDLVSIAKRMKNLKSYVHVSTAYSHCYRNDIDEAFFEEPISGRKLLALIETFDDEELKNITPSLLNKWPNTYTYTKAVSEDVYKTESDGLPVAIVRPSIITSTAKEPIAGWVDNVYGPIAVTVGACLGLLRVLQIKSENKLDLIPADYVVNNIIAAAYKVGKEPRLNNEIVAKFQNGTNIPIYNAVSCNESFVTWDSYRGYLEKSAPPVSTTKLIYHYMLFFVQNLYLFHFLDFVLHYIPAYIADGLAFCVGRKRLCVAGYNKAAEIRHAVSYFTLKEWQFYNRNTRNLYEEMSENDKRVFPFSMNKFNWEKFMDSYCYGIRVYILKDPIETLPQGLQKLRIVAITHYCLVTTLIYLAYKGLSFIYRMVL